MVGHLRNKLSNHSMCVSLWYTIGMAVMKVWIDQDLCTGDGLCVEIAPDVFDMKDDGLAYVMQDGRILDDPGGPQGLATVPVGQEEEVIESAEECPGECIFIEVE